MKYEVKIEVSGWCVYVVEALDEADALNRAYERHEDGDNGDADNLFASGRDSVKVVGG